MADSDQMVFSITTLRYPTIEPIRKRRLTQFTDGEVGIPLCDVRDAKVTISIYDEACRDVLPLERFLHVRSMGEVVFWGPITDPEWNLTDGTVTIHALGPEFRIVKHFVRVGDTIGGEVVADNEEVDLPMTSDSMWDLVVCGENTAPQTARGVPDLGIARGLTGDSGSTSHISTQRGDQIIGAIGQVREGILGPDFDFRPQEIDEGSYAHFDTYVKMGDDNTETVKFHYGWGLDNCDGYVATPSGTSVETHRHTVSQDGLNRGTAAAEGPSSRFGPYVGWDVIGGNPVGVDDDAKDAVLAELGKGTVVAYGEAPEFLDIVVKPEKEGSSVPRYGRDFGVGDRVTASGHKGEYRKTLEARITKVTLKQTSSARSPHTELELVPRILEPGDVTSTED